MSTGMSYICTKCILEFMDSNKRIQTSLHCSGLHQITKSISQKFDTLILDTYSITINDTVYHVSPKFLTIFTKNRKTQIPIPDHLNRTKVFEKLKSLIFTENSKISVENLTLKLYLFETFPLPKNLKFRVKNLDTGFFEIQKILPFLAEAPIQNLKMVVRKLADLEFPIIQNAQKLEIIDFCAERNQIKWGSIIPRLPNPEVILKESKLTPKSIIRIFKKYIDKEIGSSLVYESSKKSELQGIVSGAYRYFGGIEGELKDEKEREICITPCIIIPITPTSEFIFYGIENSGHQGLLYSLKIKVVPTGTATPITATLDSNSGFFEKFLENFRIPELLVVQVFLIAAVYVFGWN